MHGLESCRVIIHALKLGTSSLKWPIPCHLVLSHATHRHGSGDSMDKGLFPLGSTDEATYLEGGEFRHVDSSPQGQNLGTCLFYLLVLG